MLRQGIVDSLEQCQRGWTAEDGTVHPPGSCLSLNRHGLTAHEIAELVAHLPATLTTLDLADNFIGDEGARALAPHLPATLAKLNLDGTSIGDEGVKALAPHIPVALTTLNLSGNNISVDGAKALAPYLPNSFTALDLSGNSIGDENVRALAPYLPRALTTLDLGCNAIGAEGARTLAAHLPPTLTTLRLWYNSIGTDGVKALVADLPATLTTLDLGGNSIGTDGAKALAAHLPAALTTLDLHNNSIGDDGARALAAYFPTTLTTLNLWGNSIGADGVRALAAQLPTTLTTLTLGNNSLGNDGVRVLAAHLPATLTTLDLWDNSIGDKGAQTLAAHLPAALTTLDLHKNSIGDEGARALAAYLPTTLTRLNLASNSLGTDGVKALAAHLPATLTTLDLWDNSIGDKGAQALAAHLPAMLSTLKLGDNSIGADGVRALAAHLPAALTTLDLRGNSIGAEGAKALAVHLPAALTTLNLKGNSIGAEGAKALAAHLPVALTKLDLDENSIGDEGARALAPHLPVTLTTLSLNSNFIRDKGAQTLFDRLDRVRSLQFLYLMGNDIGLSDSLLVRSSMAPKSLIDLWRAQRQASERGDYLLAAKAVVLGNGGGGKTMLTRWLAWWNANESRTSAERSKDRARPDPKAPSPATHAFEQLSYEVPITIDGVQKSLDLNVYDFGGQVEIHSAHRFFMAAKRNIFVILVSRAHADGHAPPRPGANQSEEGRKLEYYLRMASHYGRSEGRGADGKPAIIYQPVIVVVGWEDQRDQPNGRDWPNEAELRKIHPNTTVVRGYANVIDRKTEAAMGIDRVAKAIRVAVNSDVIVNQVKSEGEIAAVKKARAGIRAKMSSQGGFVRALINPLDVVDPETTPTLPWYPALFTEAERSKPISPGGGAGGTSQHEAAVLILRDVGMIHYVGDVAIALRSRDEDSLADVRNGSWASARVGEAGRAGVELRNMFFCPERIKHGVYNVIRSPESAATGELLGTLTDAELRSRLGKGGQDLAKQPGVPASDHADVIKLMQASELIYRTDRAIEGAAGNRWLVPDHLPPATDRERSDVALDWGSATLMWTPLHVPSSVLWRYLAPKVNDQIAWTGDLPRRRDLGIAKFGTTPVLLVARPDEARIDAFVPPNAQVSNAAQREQQRTMLAGRVIADLNAVLGITEARYELDAAERRITDHEIQREILGAWLEGKAMEAGAWRGPNRLTRTGIPQPSDLVFGKYLLVRRLGKGGFGHVYEAFNYSCVRSGKSPSPQRVALKFVPIGVEGSPTHLRAQREYEVSKRLAESCKRRQATNRVVVIRSCTLHDCGSPHAVKVAVLECDFIVGESLLDWAAGASPRSRRERLRVFIDACLGVEQLHAAKHLHRDLKPGNILVDAQGRAHIIDLGSVSGGARSVRVSNFPITADRSGAHVPGTRDYRPPEHGTADEGPCTDVYALGVTLRSILGEHEVDTRLFGLIDTATTHAMKGRLKSVTGFRELLERCAND
jgi:Ran GTPase-activating protein (RanGAP) involved in mRNA processing and transport